MRNDKKAKTVNTVVRKIEKDTAKARSLLAELLHRNIISGRKFKKKMRDLDKNIEKVNTLIRDANGRKK